MGITIEAAGYFWESKKLGGLLFGIIKFAIVNTTGSYMGSVWIAPVVLGAALQMTHTIYFEQKERIHPRAQQDITRSSSNESLIIPKNRKSESTVTWGTGWYLRGVKMQC